jgi:hypothetical protein
MSASHNKVLDMNQEAVDRKILKKAEEYRKKKSMVSYKFQRVKNAPVDEVKFLTPIYKDIPILAFQVTYAMMNGLKVSVVGSDEVKLVVDKLREYLPIKKEDLIFVHEGEKLSLGNSISRGANALEMDSKDFFWFVPLDMPFHYDFASFVLDKDIKNHAMILDFNAKERVFENIPELFPRNYYLRMKYGGKTYSIKEPNIVGFSAGISSRLSSAADEAYAHRQSGAFGPKQLGLMTMNNIAKHLLFFFEKMEIEGAFDLSSFAGWFVMPRLTKSAKPLFKSETAEKLGYFINMAHVRCKAEHQDPFRVKDIDAWHDLWFYCLAVKENKGIQGIVPYAGLIEGFNDVMQTIKSDIGILKDFPRYANERADALKLGRPFNSNGELIVGPSYGEKIEETVEYLHNRLKKEGNF